MNERAILEQRVVTLTGLLETPGGPLGSTGGDIAAELTSRWATERRLLERVLSEATGNQIKPTVDAWRKRTEEFIARSGSDSPSWSDREGNTWHALQVLELLCDAQERLDSWQSEPGSDE